MYRSYYGIHSSTGFHPSTGSFHLMLINTIMIAVPAILYSYIVSLYNSLFSFISEGFNSVAVLARTKTSVQLFPLCFYLL